MRELPLGQFYKYGNQSTEMRPAFSWKKLAAKLACWHFIRRWGLDPKETQIKGKGRTQGGGNGIWWSWNVYAYNRLASLRSVSRVQSEAVLRWWMIELVTAWKENVVSLLSHGTLLKRPLEISISQTVQWGLGTQATPWLLLLFGGSWAKFTLKHGCILLFSVF